VKPFTPFQNPRRVSQQDALALLDALDVALGMADRSNALAAQHLDGATVTPDQHREFREALTGYQAGVQQMRATPPVPVPSVAED
jgi:hypothetical protein